MEQKPDIHELRKSYDAAAKRLLSYKEVIANILKYTVREFKGYSIPEIVACLEGKPEIGTVPVDDDFLPKMDVAGSETISEKEGVRSYDIKFKVKLPTQEEAEAGDYSMQEESTSTAISSGGNTDESVSGMVNINTADAAALKTLTGIGEAKAQAILSYREEHGAFSTVEEIMQVPGIKESTFSAIKDKIAVK